MTTRLAMWSVPCVLAGTLLGCKADTEPPTNAPGAPTTIAGSVAPAAAGTGGGATTPSGSTTPPPTTGTKPTGSAGSVSTGTAGSAPTTAPTATAGTSAPVATAGAAAPAGGAAAPATGATAYPDVRGACNINSGYADDHACILPPSPEEGMQIHVGPSNYQDAAEVAKYILKPGQETSECWTFHTPNDKPIHYQTFLMSGRAGTHHIINTMYRTDMADGGFGTCADPGTGTNGDIIDNLPGASKPYMPRGTVAPENQHIGRLVPAKATAQADMHYYNFTDKDIIREFWMNIYYAKDEDITMEAQQIRGMGGISWSAIPIPAKSEKTYPYECAITGEGRILSLLGHYHSHGKRFTASIRRAAGGAVDKVFEMYDYLDPATFEYDSVNKNPTFSETNAGAVSGMLDVHSGDTLLWECHIVNDSNVGLTYTNELKTGEMCNLWGSSLGIPALNCVLP